ncbi:GNAT family acetyltransferase [Scytonema hofmannii PCC 7110]|uniref:GNAT family acetyltransferase n=1 Tax=Scytonema hofmannii PCC 7110 TaxID=128403 RepID=A0A139WSL1_9CYAN|nr:GNAT family N-acetyltransferase [Scytonema hofmannii]KYC35422.1 GNAT family acetyltransferase [Scytonema hofmannii PCC 7110]
MTLLAPVPLADTHLLDDFDCGVASLNDWLKRRAVANQKNSASRTYVIADEQKVIAYYCLSSGALALSETPSPIKRNMPDPIPVAILGRLGVDTSWKGQGLGAALLQDAVFRTMQAAEILGIRGLVVHAISEEAKQFYEHYGFSPSPTQPMTLILSIKKVTV